MSARRQSTLGLSPPSSLCNSHCHLSTSHWQALAPAIIFGVATSNVRWWQSGLNLGFIGTVVAGLVVATILAVSGRIPAVVWGVAAWRWLVRPVPVPLLVLVVMIGVLIVFAARIVLKSLKFRPPAWLDYVQDNFLGIVWRWRYEGSHLVESSIRPFCPQCGTGLRGEQQGYREMTTSFICDECPFAQDIPGNVEQVIDRIGRLIERAVNQRLTQPRP